MLQYCGNYIMGLDFRAEDIADICRSGANDEAVEYTRNQPYMRAQLDLIPEIQLRSEMRESFFEDGDDAVDLDTVEQRVIWIAAWQIHDSPEEENDSVCPLCDEEKYNDDAFCNGDHCNKQEHEHSTREVCEACVILAKEKNG